MLSLPGVPPRLVGLTSSRAFGLSGPHVTQGGDANCNCNCDGMSSKCNCNCNCNMRATGRAAPQTVFRLAAISQAVPE